jgi:hypothetical protein
MQKYDYFNNYHHSGLKTYNASDGDGRVVWFHLTWSDALLETI